MPLSERVNLTEAEWFQAIAILTEARRMTRDKRQEFILFSDTLGVSMVVDLLNHRKTRWRHRIDPVRTVSPPGRPRKCPGAATSPISTRPEWRPGRRASDRPRRPADHGRVARRWQAQTNGLYDLQDPTLQGMHRRCKFRSDGEGRFLARTVRPVHYPLPSDGPVGAMLRAAGRQPWLPAHIHFAVSTEGYEPVITHIFGRSDEYLTAMRSSRPRIR
jgi:hydroxyquinol 1,2-dioxygenase